MVPIPFKDWPPFLSKTGHHSCQRLDTILAEDWPPFLSKTGHHSCERLTIRFIRHRYTQVPIMSASMYPAEEHIICIYCTVLYWCQGTLEGRKGAYNLYNFPGAALYLIPPVGRGGGITVPFPPPPFIHPNIFGPLSQLRDMTIRPGGSLS
jgi:hypothetical protein